MQIQVSNEIDIVIFCFVLGPLSETFSLNTFEGDGASITFGTRVASSQLPIPLKAPCTINIDAFAEPQIGLLAIFAPQAIIVPSVHITVGIDCGYKDPVKFFDKFGQSGHFP